MPRSVRIARLAAVRRPAIPSVSIAVRASLAMLVAPVWDVRLVPSTRIPASTDALTAVRVAISSSVRAPAALMCLWDTTLRKARTARPRVLPALSRMKAAWLCVLCALLALTKDRISKPPVYRALLEEPSAPRRPLIARRVHADFSPAKWACRTALLAPQVDIPMIWR